MNQRIKVEGSVDKIANRTRSAPKRATSSRKSPKKRPPIITLKDNSSDEEFVARSHVERRKSTLRKTTNSRHTNRPSSSLRTSNRKNTSGRNIIYQITDSSDDDIHTIPNTSNEIDLINLCETEDSIVGSQETILNDIIQQTKNKQDNSNPSTSNAYAVSSASSNVPDFVDDLLCSNGDLFDENFFKPLKELNKQTDKLLASSWDLINTGSTNRNVEDSVVHICPDENSSKLRNEGNKPPQPAVSNIDLTKPEEEQKISAQCPICLEKLGLQPLSSTICGHIFCTRCIQDSITSQRKCPTCRKRLTPRMIHPLFLF